MVETEVQQFLDPFQRALRDSYLIGYRWEYVPNIGFALIYDLEL